jgi:hypothetical protein
MVKDEKRPRNTFRGLLRAFRRFEIKTATELECTVAAVLSALFTYR